MYFNVGGKALGEIETLGSITGITFVGGWLFLGFVLSLKKKNPNKQNPQTWIGGFLLSGFLTTKWKTLG